MRRETVRIRREQVLVALVRKNVSQRWLALAIGMSETRLSNAVRGYRSLSRAEAKAIAAKLGVSTRALIEARREEVRTR